MARPHIEPFVDRDVVFKPMTLAGFKPGMHYKTLSIDSETGASSLTVQYDASFKQPPGFSYTEYEFLLMEGTLQVGDTLWQKGAYFFVPPGVALGAISTETGASGLLLTNFGPPSFEESDADHDDADRSGLVMINAYDDLDWITMPRRMPGVTGRATSYMPKVFL